MKRKVVSSSLCVAASLLIAAGCRSSAPDLTRADSQRRFGVKMAKMNLWREAAFRFQRAVDMNPQDAMAHNNLAVACEANGDFDAAAKEYREALRLDRTNQYIQKNYSRFVEFTQRSKKRSTAKTAASDATAKNGTKLSAPSSADSSGMPRTPAVPPTVMSPQPTQPDPNNPVVPPNPPMKGSR